MTILLKLLVWFLVGSDPYIFEEKDPLKSNALNSSLWELVSLKQHILPKVGKSVNFLFKKLPQVEWDMSELLDDSYESVSKNQFCIIKKHLYVIRLISSHWPKANKK